MTRRLYTFGCSFTRFCWPTWADLLLSQYDTGQNWGMGGGGNKYIFESLIECEVSNKLTKDDTVVIMWSSWMREDRFINGWQLRGNIFKAEPLYDKAYIQKYWTEKGAALHNFNLICAAIRFLEGIGCKWVMSNMTPLMMYESRPLKPRGELNISKEEFKKYFDYIDQYKDNWVKQCMDEHPTTWPNIPLIKWKYDTGLSPEGHPTPRIHGQWLIENFNFLTEYEKAEILRLSIHYQNELEYVKDNLLPKTFYSRAQMMEIVGNYFKEFLNKSYPWSRIK